MNKYFQLGSQAGKNRQFGATSLGYFCRCLLLLWVGLSAGLSADPVKAATVTAPGPITKPSAGQAAITFQLYFIRHAHKQSGDATAPDPRLSACGEAQAAALATLLQHLDLKTLYHTPYQRTRQTAAALLQPKRQLQLYQPADTVAFSQQLLAQQDSALVVGHSNTVPQLIQLLSNQHITALTEQDYGMIYQLNFRGTAFLSLQQFELPPLEICQQQSH